MKIIKFGETELQVDDNYTFSTNEVAKGYGISPSVVRTHKSLHSDELVEGIHFLYFKDSRNRNTIRWTLEGVHMLGFFIKSERAKEFRKFTAKLLTEIKKGNAQVVAAGCKADQIMTPRIMAYKANLSKKNKQIEKLRQELYKMQIELMKAKEAQYHIDERLKRHINERAQQLAKKMEKALLSIAQELEKEIKELAKTATAEPRKMGNLIVFNDVGIPIQR